MQNAIGLRLDFEAGAAYVAYRRLPEGSRVEHVTRLSDDVVVQFDSGGEVLGIGRSRTMSVSIGPGRTA